MRPWLGLVLAASRVLAQAHDRQGCSDAIEQALRVTKPAASELGLLVAQHCKPWPVAADHLFAAVMAFQSAARTPEGQDAWDVAVALLDAHTLRARHLRWMHVDFDALTGIDEYSFKLDTAPWQVAPDLRALGLRFHSSAYGSPYAEAFWSDELTLLVPDGAGLRAVLGVVTQARRRTGQGPDDWQHAKLRLSMGSPGPKGWADIVITDSGDGTDGAKHRWVYRYDGKAFGPLAKPAPFWAGYCCALNW